MWCGNITPKPCTHITTIEHEEPQRQRNCASARMLLAFDTVANTIIRHCSNRTQLRKTSLVLTAFIAITLMMQQPAHSGPILDSIANQFETATTGWMQNSYALGSTIFLSLAGCTLVYNLAAYYLDNGSTAGIGSVLKRSLLGIFLPYSILQGAPNFLYHIIQIAGQISGRITGQTPGEVVAQNGVSPDSLVMTGIKIAWQLPTTTWHMLMNTQVSILHLVNLVITIVLVIFSVVMAIPIILCFWFIAAELLIAYIEIIFLAPLGTWALGFSGTPAMSSIAESYVSTIFRMIGRFIVILAMVTIVQNIANGWINMMPTYNPVTKHIDFPQAMNVPSQPLSDPELDVLKIGISILGSSALLLYIVRYISQLAGNLIGGHPILSGQGALTNTHQEIGDVKSAFRR